jgi:hypothetical protein
MVAYSFKKHFATPILEGSKAQTIRADRKRHARAGETLQLYTGMRTKHCRLVGTAICAAVQPVTIDFRVEAIAVAGRPLIKTGKGLDKFARQDGFADWAALRAFWEAEHGAIGSWSGILICWKDFQVNP